MTVDDNCLVVLNLVLFYFFVLLMTVRQRNKLLILSYFLGIASLHSKLHMQVLPPCGLAWLLHPHISMNGFRLSK